MASSFEKSVKGGTKIKLAAPKSKYVEHILVATHAGEAGVAEVFRVLQNRLRDSTWTIVFKSLIIVHFMIREGEADVTLRYLANHPQRKLATNHFTEGTWSGTIWGNVNVKQELEGLTMSWGWLCDFQTQGRNIRYYADYLLQRALSYSSTKVDYVRSGEGRLKRLSIDKGLLREVESVQDVIKALVRCDFFAGDAENDITLTALRLLTSDLLALFHAMNEGMINILEHYFELSKPDAERALSVYRGFVNNTKNSVAYFSMARQYELSTGINVPKIKHAPITLAESLEEYLRDPDFEQNRRRYISEKEFKKTGKSSTNSTNKPTFESKPTTTPASSGAAFPSPKASQAVPATQPATQPAKGPAPDLIDFFDSIEQNPNQYQSQYQQAPPPQQSMLGQQPNIQTQATGFNPQQAYGAPQIQGTNPFGQPQQQQQQPQQLQQTPTGAGFGGYTPQPQQPFAQQSSLQSIPQNGVPNFQQQQPAELYGSQQQPVELFGSQPTGQPQITSPVNPYGAQQPPAPQLQPQPTSTNPFRQSMMPTGSTVGTITSPSVFTPNTTGSTVSTLPQRTATNPFAKHTTGGPASPFGQQQTGFQSQPLPTIQQGQQTGFQSSLSPIQQGVPTQQFQQQPTGFSSQPTGFSSPPTGFSSQPTGFQQQPTGIPSIQTPPSIQQPQQPQPLQPAPTGTNPFAKNLASPPPANGLSPPPGGPMATSLMSNVTGSTNPFRQSAFVNQATGQGWQNSSQGTMGGLEHLDTVPIFPRPGQQQQGQGQQQMPQQWQ